MLGFELDIWDYLTFLTAFVAAMSAIAILLWIAGLPGQIAIARKHPEAEADRLALLPDFSISLTGERVADHLLRQLKLNPWLASAGVGMTLPIYEGGALRAQVKIATAQQAQAVSNYGGVVLKAFKEVEDAIASEQTLAKRLQYEQRALADSTRAVQLATVQYQAGKRDLLWVEQLQTEQLAVERRFIQLRNAKVTNRIQLHLALGGSFDASSPMGGLAVEE